MTPRWTLGTLPDLSPTPLLADLTRQHARITRALGPTLATVAGSQSLTAPSPQGRVPRRVMVPPRIAFASPDDPQSSARRTTDASSTSAQDSDTTGSDGDAWDLDDAWTWNDLTHAVLDGLTLPHLDAQRTAPGSAAPDTVTTHAIPGGPWDRRQTLRAHLLRRARAGTPSVDRLHPDDLRYHTVTPAPPSSGGAVLFAMMDTSGSMGAWEKHLAKALLFWTTQLLRRDYPTVTIVFIAHDVRAKELSETAFFQKGVSGGTVASAAFRLALEILDRRFPLPVYNAYGMYLSDGGNLTSDNPPAQALAADLTQRLNLFAVGELHDTDRKPSMLFTALDQTPARTALLQSDQDLLPTLRTFFHP